MPEDKGGEKREELNKENPDKERSFKKKASKERSNHAKKVKKDVSKFVAKGQREEFKKDVAGPVEPVNPFETQPAPSTEPPIQQGFDSRPMEPSPESAGLSSQSINPPDSTLPTSDHEIRYQQEGEEGVVDDLFDADQVTDAPPAPSGDTVEPVNPFETQPQATPLEKKALDDKPLDEPQKEADVVVKENAPIQEENTAEDMRQAVEVPDQSNGEVREPDDASSEPLQAEPEEKPRPAPVASEDAPGVQVEVVQSDPTQEGPGGGAPSAGEPVETFDPEGGIMVDDLDSDFWNIMEQAGITKKKFYTIIIVIIVLVLGLFGFVFGWFDFDFGGNDQPAAPLTDVSVDVPDNEGPISPSSGIISSYIFGLEFVRPAMPIRALPIGSFSTNAPVDAAFIFGLPAKGVDPVYVEYVEIARNLRNLYKTDIYAMLDNSTDRRGTLERHLEEFSSLTALAEDVFVEMNGILVGLENQYTSVADRRDVHEQEFFTYLRNYEGKASNEALDAFVEYSNQSTEIKAKFQAYVALRDIYANVLTFVNPRLKDIDANFEALIKGVHVFDIAGSDIDAIIPLE